jgi:hypothetical protein
MKYLYLITAVLIATACNSKKTDLEQRVENLEEKVNTEQAVTPANSNIVSTENTAGKLPVLTFKEKTFDFKSIKEGEKVKHTFEFTNTGEAPLVIQNASASCGCTVPDWPKDPIAPGKSGKIDVEFNSSGKSGPQSKTVSITANTNPSITTVTIVGTIEASK